MSDTNLIQVDNFTDSTVYGKGDTCLLINPFDTYHMFRIHNNWNSDSINVMNLANGNQNFYLIFKNKKKEIRIGEYINAASNYKVDKSQGELLFKISKSEAKDILSLGTNTFYVTRIFEETDDTGNLTFTSGEEVLFTGNWADENSWSGNSMSATIKALQKKVVSLSSQNISLNAQLSESTVRLETLKTANDELQDRIDSLEAENSSLQEALSRYEEADEYTSVVISDKATYTYEDGSTEGGSQLDKKLKLDNNDALSKLVVGKNKSETISKINNLTEAQYQTLVNSVLRQN